MKKKIKHIIVMKKHLLEIKLTLCLFVIMAFASLNLEAQSLRLVMMPVGSGDACLVIFPNGKKMLIDSGTEGKYEDIVEPFLSRHCITYLDYWVNSHPHPDHVGGEAEMQSSGMIDSNTTLWDRNTFDYEDAFTVEGVDFFIYNVKDNGFNGSGANVNSLAFRMEYNGWVYTTGGDEGLTSTNRFLNDHPSLVPAHVRKIAHHGYGPIDPTFLRVTDAHLFMIPHKDEIVFGSWFSQTFIPDVVNWLHANGGRLDNPGYSITGVDGFIYMKVQNANDWNYTIDTYANRFDYMLPDWTQCVSSNNYDAGLTDVLDLVNPGCNSTTLDPVVRVQNVGVNDLSSCVITYDIDGGTAHTYNWSGNLPQGISEDVSLPTMTVSTVGSHTFNAEISQPNGNNDQGSGNDNISSNFSIVLNTNSLDFDLTTDCWGDEITWSIVDSYGTTVSSGGPYHPSIGGVAIYQQLCLPDGCYDFIINDSYGDGMWGSVQANCSVDGDYTISDGSGTLLVQMINPNFGSGTTHNFCIKCMRTYGANCHCWQANILRNTLR